MGLRFRRSVRLFPGVRLNFSKSGISTTIGGRGAGVTFGSRGTYANVGLPGTGLSFRTRLDIPAEKQGSPRLPVIPLDLTPQLEVPLAPQPQPGAVQIHSGAVSAMTSAGLSELKRLINEAALRKTVLLRAVQEQTSELEAKRRKLAFAKAFIVRLFTKGAVERMTPEVQQLEIKLDDTKADLEGCHIDVDFGLDDAASGTYAALCRSFEALRTCEKLWDVTDSAQTDRHRERTTATSRVSRTPVAFEYSEVELVRSSYRTMLLRNASSFEIHLFPGFLLTKETGSDFALVEWKDFSLDLALTRFIENDPVPGDSNVIGQTWAKTNKDGSPDRRFSDNYQIPIVQYAQLWLRSPTGLYESYMVSNVSKAEDFNAAVVHHKDALSRISQVAPPDEPPAIEESEALPQPEPQEESPSLALDWLALAAVVAIFACCGYWASTAGKALLARATAPKPLIAATAAATPQPAMLPSVYVIPTAANIRAAPSASGAIVAKARQGEKLFVYQVQGAWAHVGADRPIGWILASLTSPNPPPAN